MELHEDPMSRFLFCLSGKACAAAVLIAVTLSVPAIAWSQLARPPRAERGDLRDLNVGVLAAEMPVEGFFQFACGSNGGTPLQPLGEWTEFRQCTPEANGLYEVYVEYDDEKDFGARMMQQLMDAEMDLVPRYTVGTRVAGHPVVLSVLFDAGGVARVIRAVTDTRADFEYRRNAYLLRVPIMGVYGRDGWECVDIPLAVGETPVGGFHVKARCEKDAFTGRHVVVESHLYRKAGQTGHDRAGVLVEGDFWSLGIMEIWDPETFAAFAAAN